MGAGGGAAQGGRHRFVLLRRGRAPAYMYRFGIVPLSFETLRRVFGLGTIESSHDSRGGFSTTLSIVSKNHRRDLRDTLLIRFNSNEKPFRRGAGAGGAFVLGSEGGRVMRCFTSQGSSQALREIAPGRPCVEKGPFGERRERSGFWETPLSLSANVGRRRRRDSEQVGQTDAAVGARRAQTLLATPTASLSSSKNKPVCLERARALDFFDSFRKAHLDGVLESAERGSARSAWSVTLSFEGARPLSRNPSSANTSSSG